MRATTLSTANVSRTTRAARMLELSPDETAAKPSASSMPASIRTSRSKPTPLTVRPPKSGPSRRKASTSTSITATVWPRFSSERARVEPTRPHPMITMCTLASVGQHAFGEPWLESLLVVRLSELGKRLLIGRKLSSTQLGETLLPKRIALPVFASDALSSVAYAPDEILITLSLAGLAAYAFSWKIAILVAVVMLVVVASYRQNVHAYPSGGGDYEVATVNLGPNAGLTVGSALLVDYVLTVAVSISSGVQNAKSVPLLHFLDGHEALAASIAVVILAALNLRGVRESGGLFAVPTYCFMAGMLIMIGCGLFRILVLGEPLQAESAQYAIEAEPRYADATGFLLIALLARTFSSGCAALTGVEAISNGVPAFQKPKSKNAATTLLLLGTVAVTMVIGVIVLAHLTGLRLIDEGRSHYLLNGERVDVIEKTGIAQLADVVFNDFRPGFYFVIAATFIILFLAANTAFNGFPVLGSILAKDGYLPRQLHTRGDRLAYSNGIVVLSALAIVLIVAFRADVTALIQLYVVGVFVSFTVSQTGMLRHWTRLLQTEQKPAERARMKRSRVINGIGLTMTGTVLVIVLLSKFTQGAYIAIIAMAVIFLLMKGIRRHYEHVAEETALVRRRGPDAAQPASAASSWSASCTSRRCGRSPSPRRRGRARWRP